MIRLADDWQISRYARAMWDGYRPRPRYRIDAAVEYVLALPRDRRQRVVLDSELRESAIDFDLDGRYGRFEIVENSPEEWRFLQRAFLTSAP